MQRSWLLALLWLCLSGVSTTVGAQPTAATAVEIERTFLGSGEPEQRGFENATAVINDSYHAPQYMPGYPTAATLWARTIEVPCTRSVEGRLQCKGYQWSPAMGRAEYLYFRPVLTAMAPAAASDSAPTPVAPSSSSSGAGPAPLPPKPARN